MLTRQLSVFSNLLLHQISCLLTDFGLPFPSPWCFSVCPLTHHHGIWRGKISRVCQCSRSEGLIQSGPTSGWAARGEESSLAQPREPSLLLPEVHPTRASLVVGAEERKGGHRSSFSTPNTPPRLLELQLIQQTCAYQPEPFFGTVPFGNILSWPFGDTLWGLHWSKQWHKPSSCSQVWFVGDIFTTCSLFCSSI